MPTNHSAATATVARPSASFQMRAEVRLFHTNGYLACRKDPELFFDPRKRNRAIRECADCPFRGRCGYNAVAMGATHGIWGGMMLPGDYPHLLRPMYARLSQQFEQRRTIELGDMVIAPLPEIGLVDNCTARGLATPGVAAEQMRPPSSGGGIAEVCAPRIA
jgi:WhiB family transcriptional regulator, redox-sensing transcriptional regulator